MSSRVRDLRIAAGLAQTPVATEVGISRQELSFIESGRIEVSKEMYASVEKAIIALTRRKMDSVTRMIRTA